MYKLDGYGCYSFFFSTKLLYCIIFSFTFPFIITTGLPLSLYGVYHGVCFLGSSFMAFSFIFFFGLSCKIWARGSRSLCVITRDRTGPPRLSFFYSSSFVCTLPSAAGAIPRGRGPLKRNIILLPISLFLYINRRGPFWFLHWLLCCVYPTGKTGRFLIHWHEVV